MKTCFAKIISSFACLFLLILFFAISASSQITIENRIREDVPLKIEVKNADSQDWVKDLEIEVTNTGKKPIYYLFFVLVFDDTKTEINGDIGYSFVFGNGSLYARSELAKADDVSIQPAQRRTFKISESFVKSWEIQKSQPDFVEPKTAHFRLGWVSFGDGTVRDGSGNLLQKRAN